MLLARLLGQVHWGWLTIHEELHVMFSWVLSFAEGLKEQSRQEVSFLLRFRLQKHIVGRPELVISRASKRADGGAIFAPPGASLALVIHKNQWFCTR